MFLCIYIVLKASSCVTFSMIFTTRAIIICIDSGTRDMICVSLALAIRFFDISINRYTPRIDTAPVMESVNFGDFTENVVYFGYQWPQVWFAGMCQQIWLGVRGSVSVPKWRIASLTFEMSTVLGQQHSFSTHEQMFLWKCQSFWVSKIRKNIYRSNMQVRFELYGDFRCLQVIYST